MGEGGATQKTCLQHTEPLAETSLPTFSSRRQQAGRRSTFMSWPSVPSLNTRADISLHANVARCLSGAKAEEKKGLERAYGSLTAAQRLTAWAPLFSLQSCVVVGVVPYTYLAR